MTTTVNSMAAASEWFMHHSTESVICECGACKVRAYTYPEAVTFFSNTVNNEDPAAAVEVPDNELIYLATPYCDPDPAVKELTFNTVNRAAVQIMNEGHHVFSPISMSHPIALAGELPGDWSYWESFDRVMLAACTKIIVLMLPGWALSVGVTAEIKIALEMGILIEYLDPSDITVRA